MDPAGGHKFKFDFSWAKFWVKIFFGWVHVWRLRTPLPPPYMRGLPHMRRWLPHWANESICCIGIGETKKRLRYLQGQATGMALKTGKYGQTRDNGEFHYKLLYSVCESRLFACFPRHNCRQGWCTGRQIPTNLHKRPTTYYKSATSLPPIDCKPATDFFPGMHWKGGSRAPSLCPATVPLMARASANGIQNRQ